MDTNPSRAAPAPSPAPSVREPRARAGIGFRPLARRDLERLHGWLNDPVVARWYTRRTRAAIGRKYGPRIDGRSPTRVYVVKLDARCIGLAQTYRIADYPDFAAALGAAPGWAGLDYLIGTPEFRGLGLAHRIVDAFVTRVVAAMPGVETCASLPAHGNVRSVRSLERAGFRAHGRVEIERGQLDVLMLRGLAADNARGSGRRGAA